MSETGWLLHPQLGKDTVMACDLALSRVLAMNDAEFPWLILVPRRTGVGDIIDLGDEQAILMEELSLISHVLKEETKCDKLNVAAIGNVVPQLHIHVVAGRDHARDLLVEEHGVLGCLQARLGDVIRVVEADPQELPWPRRHEQPHLREGILG